MSQKNVEVVRRGVEGVESARRLGRRPWRPLTLLVALKLDFATVFFQHARDDLLGDSEYGYSNCLMLLDGLLRRMKSHVLADVA